MSFENPPPRIEQVLNEAGAFSQPWSGWFRKLWTILSPGKNVTLTLVKLTGGGANGSVTFTNGVMTDYVEPT